MTVNYVAIDHPCANCGHYILSQHRWHYEFRYPPDDDTIMQAFQVYDGCVNDIEYCDCQEPVAKESGPA